MLTLWVFPSSMACSPSDLLGHMVLCTLILRGHAMLSGIECNPDLDIPRMRDGGVHCRPTQLATNSVGCGRNVAYFMAALFGAMISRYSSKTQYIEFIRLFLVWLIAAPAATHRLAAHVSEPKFLHRSRLRDWFVRCAAP